MKPTMVLHQISKANLQINKKNNMGRRNKRDEVIVFQKRKHKWIIKIYTKLTLFGKDM